MAGRVDKENRTTFQLDKKDFGPIKGAALLLMLAHHFYGFPDTLTNGAVYPNTLVLTVTAGYWVEHAGRICVSLFAFLTGYAACRFHPEGFSLPSGLRKARMLLERYWLILFAVFLPLAYFLTDYIPTRSEILLNLFALRNCVIPYAWYVYFFVFAMLALPLCIRCFRGKKWTGFLLPVLLCAGLSEYFTSIRVEHVSLAAAAGECFYTFPMLWTGYCCAENDVFTQLSRRLPVNNFAVGLCGVLCVLVCRICLHDVGQLCMDVLYAPVATYFLAAGFHCLKQSSPVGKAFALLGRHAGNVWLLHAMFFSDYLGHSLQRLVYAPIFPPLVLLFAFCICLPASAIVEACLRPLDGLIDGCPHPAEPGV